MTNLVDADVLFQIHGMQNKKMKEKKKIARHAKIN